MCTYDANSLKIKTIYLTPELNWHYMHWVDYSIDSGSARDHLCSEKKENRTFSNEAFHLCQFESHILSLSEWNYDRIDWDSHAKKRSGKACLNPFSFNRNDWSEWHVITDVARFFRHLSDSSFLYSAIKFICILYQIIVIPYNNWIEVIEWKRQYIWNRNFIQRAACEAERNLIKKCSK